MDFNPKTSRLRNHEEMDKYLANYSFRLNPRIKVEFCPHCGDISQAPPNDGIYMHPRVLALGLRMPMTKFIRSVLTFYRVAPSVDSIGLAYGTRVRGPLRFVRHRGVSV